MMRGRVSAQLFTILAFVGYMGMDYFDFRAAPFTQDAMKNNEANSETQKKLDPVNPSTVAIAAPNSPKSST